MRIVIQTSVSASVQKIKEGFTRELFIRLNPPFPPFKLLQFDGCVKGDTVRIELNFILFKQNWISEITEDDQDDREWYFIDEGTTLPFFIKSWKHRHRVCLKSENQSVIIDDVTFATGTLLTDLLLYPALYFQFLYRRPIYKRIFNAEITGRK